MGGRVKEVAILNRKFLAGLTRWPSLTAHQAYMRHFHSQLNVCIYLDFTEVELRLKKKKKKTKKLMYLVQVTSGNNTI